MIVISCVSKDHLVKCFLPFYYHVLPISTIVALSHERISILVHLLSKFTLGDELAAEYLLLSLFINKYVQYS